MFMEERHQEISDIIKVNGKSQLRKLPRNTVYQMNQLAETCGYSNGKEFVKERTEVRLLPVR